MNEETRVLVVPAHFQDACPEAMARYLEGLRSVLKGLDVEYTITSTLHDLDSVENVRNDSRRHDHDIVLLYLMSWVDANVAVELLQQIGDAPLVVWSTDWFDHKGRKTHVGALAGYLPIKGSLEYMDIPFIGAYGNPDRVGMDKEITDALAGAKAVAVLRNARIGMVGYTPLGMYPGMVNPLDIKKQTGTEIIPIDNYTLLQRCDSLRERKAKISAAHDLGLEQVDPITEQDQRTCLAMTEALRELVKKHKLSAITTRCCFELATEYGFAPCVPLSLLSDEVTASCESDIPLVITQLVLGALSGRPTAYVDIIMMEESLMYCSCCGFGAFAYAAGQRRRCGYSASGAATSELDFRRMINRSKYEEGTYTLARINVSPTRPWSIQTIIGEHTGEFEPFYEYGCNEFPSLGIALKQNTAGLLKTLQSQHFALVKGDVSQSLACFAELMGMEII